MLVSELIAWLQKVPQDLPVVMTRDCWQWELETDERPRVALWTGDGVGTPKTSEQLQADGEYMSESYAAEFDKPCVCIGRID